MSMDIAKCAQEIIQHLGGEGNIWSAAVYPGELRFEVDDEDKADKPALRKIAGIVTAYGRGVQVNIVPDEGKAEEIFAEITRLVGSRPEGRQHIREDYPAAKSLDEACVGEKVTFGRYEQNHGAEPIEWVVLDRTHDRLLLISKYVLDNKPMYSTESSGIGRDLNFWKKSNIREWLNSAFYKAAFNSSEAAKIFKKPTIEDEAEASLPDGNKEQNTGDRIFLLNKEEAERFFAGDDARMCQATRYAQDHGAKMEENHSKYANYQYSCRWWLKPSRLFEGLEVRPNGAIDKINPALNSDYAATGLGVRPAMWIMVKPVAGYTKPQLSGLEKKMAEEEAAVRKQLNDVKQKLVQLRTGKFEWTSQEKKEWTELKNQASSARKEAHTYKTRYESMPEWNEVKRLDQELQSLDTRLDNLSDEDYLNTFDTVNKQIKDTETALNLANERIIAARNQYVTKLRASQEAQQKYGNYHSIHAAARERELCAQAYDAVFGTEQIGEKLYLGRYEQNGIKPIEWKVLERRGSKLLLISRYALDFQPFNRSNDHSSTWAGSDIRKWLHHNFFKAAFNQTESAFIVETEHENETYSESEDTITLPEGKTRDRIFLLSYSEADRYFPLSGSKEHPNRRAGAKCDVTVYAAQLFRSGKGDDPYDYLNGYWWLRTRHYTDENDNVALRSRVSCKFGYIQGKRGYESSSAYVRPVIWIDLGTFTSGYADIKFKVTEEEKQAARAEEESRELNRMEEHARTEQKESNARDSRRKARNARASRLKKQREKEQKEQKAWEERQRDFPHKGGVFSFVLNLILALAIMWPVLSLAHVLPQAVSFEPAYLWTEYEFEARKAEGKGTKASSHHPFQGEERNGWPVADIFAYKAANYYADDVVSAILYNEKGYVYDGNILWSIKYSEGGSYYPLKIHQNGRSFIAPHPDDKNVESVIVMTEDAIAGWRMNYGAQYFKGDKGWSGEYAKLTGPARYAYVFNILTEASANGDRIMKTKDFQVCLMSYTKGELLMYRNGTAWFAEEAEGGILLHKYEKGAGKTVTRTYERQYDGHGAGYFLYGTDFYYVNGSKVMKASLLSGAKAETVVTANTAIHSVNYITTDRGLAIFYTMPEAKKCIMLHTDNNEKEALDLDYPDPVIFAGNGRLLLYYDGIHPSWIGPLQNEYRKAAVMSRIEGLKNPLFKRLLADDYFDINGSWAGYSINNAAD